MDYEKYMPVDPDFYDVVQSLSQKEGLFKIFFFDPELNVQEAKGEYLQIKDTNIGAYFILRNGNKVRLDRIITLNGIPGPAYGEYESYAHRSSTCLIGYEDV